MAHIEKNKKRALLLVSEVHQKVASITPQQAKQKLLDSWQLGKPNTEVLSSVVFILSELNEHETAMEVLQEALSIKGESLDILELIGKIALDMQDYQIAEKVYIRAIQLAPQNVELYLHLTTCISQQGRGSEALEITKQLANKFPESSGVWNSLGMLAKNELHDKLAAREFFKQAIELKKGHPVTRENAIYCYNLSTCLDHNAEAEEYYLKHAISINSKDSQIHLSYGLFLLSQGRVQEAWPHYEFRKDFRLGYNVASKFDHKYQYWGGQDLDGQSIIICAEQGLGDEVFFLMSLSQICSEAKQVYLICDPRLIDAVERSFKNVKAFPYEDSIKYGLRHRTFSELDEYLKEKAAMPDSFALMGDIMRYRSPSKKDIMSLKPGYFLPPTKSNRYIQEKIAKKPKKLKIGFTWRSGNMKNERQFYYQSLDFYLSLAKNIDAELFVLQYDINDDEKSALKNIKNITLFDQIDLKKDIEANLTIIKNLDLVMGPPIATQCFSLAVGTPIWLFNQGKPWYFLGDNKPPGFFPEKSAWWCLDDYKTDPERLLEDTSIALQNFS